MLSLLIAKMSALSARVGLLSLKNSVKVSTVYAAGPDGTLSGSIALDCPYPGDDNTMPSGVLAKLPILAEPGVLGIQYSFSAHPTSGLYSGAFDGGKVKVNSNGVTVATFADTGMVINKIAPWQTPTLLNGWQNYGGSDATVQYRKLPDGMVLVKGKVKNGDLSSPIFTLPAGYRPSETVTLRCSGAPNPYVTAAGDVYPGVGALAELCLNFMFYPG